MIMAGRNYEANWATLCAGQHVLMYIYLAIDSISAC
jgi:hypothetical protein